MFYSTLSRGVNDDKYTLLLLTFVFHVDEVAVGEINGGVIECLDRRPTGLKQTRVLEMRVGVIAESNARVAGGEGALL